MQKALFPFNRCSIYDKHSLLQVSSIYLHLCIQKKVRPQENLELENQTYSGSNCFTKSNFEVPCLFSMFVSNCLLTLPCFVLPTPRMSMTKKYYTYIPGICHISMTTALNHQKICQCLHLGLYIYIIYIHYFF